MSTSQLVPLFRNELTKAVRRKLPYFGVLAVGLVCVITFYVHERLSTASGANAWGYLAFSMQLAFTDIGPIFIIVFPAMLLAEETSAGTIRAALAAPVHRWELYAAKAGIGLLYMLVLSLATLVFSVALAKVHYQFGAISDIGGVAFTSGQALREFLIGYALSWIPLSALVMFGLFISTIIRSPGTAVAVGISTLFLVDLTKHLVGLDPYIFTRYIVYSWTNLQQFAQGIEFQWQPDVWKMIVLCGIYAVVGFGGGLVIFVKKDLNH